MQVVAFYEDTCDQNEKPSLPSNYCRYLHNLWYDYKILYVPGNQLYTSGNFYPKFINFIPC